MSRFVEVTPELMAGFLDEAPEYLSMLDEGLLAFESKADAGPISLEDAEDHERMNEMFRAAHSLKGLAAAMGFDTIRDLTHLMETLFDHVRMGKRVLDPASIETLFSVFDKLRELVGELTDPSDEPVGIDDALAALNEILDSSPVAAGPAETPSGEGKKEGVVADTAEPVETSAAPAASVQAESISGNSVLDDADLAQLFIETTVETLDELNQGLLKLEETPGDLDVINEVFRHAHNIKGASGAAGLDGPYRLTHEMETVLDRLRAERLELEESLTNALFSAADRLRCDIELVKNGCIEELINKAPSDIFSKWLKEAEDSQTASPSGAAPPPGDAGDGGATDGDVVVHVTFPKDFAESEIQAYLINNRLGEIGTVLRSDPDLDTLDGSKSIEQITYTVETDEPPEGIESLIGAYGVESVKVVAGGGDDAAEATSAPETASSPDASSSPGASESQPAGCTGGSEAAAAGSPSEKAESVGAAKPAAPSNAAPAAPSKAPAAKPAGPSAKAASPVRKQSAPTAGETIRVDLERLDQLMNLGGELVINKARFVQIQSRFEPMFSGPNLEYLVDDISDRIARLTESVSKLSKPPFDKRVVSNLSHTTLLLGHDIDIVKNLVRKVHDARTGMNDFSEALHSLNRVSEGIQKRIMETRMVAIGPLFQRFRRAVRDMARATGKNVELVLHGEATELDKRMIDELADPLTHMVRNSVDHGTETAEERAKTTKPATARVDLDAYHRGRHICIEVRDDGKGVDVEAVKQKIIDRELATPTQVEQMTDKEIIQYVFKPGFSTAAEVTDLSGRGMGMDIVVNKIDSLNGSVEIDSVPGQGTRVTIKLPLTLAIITALVARIGKGVYAVPLEMVAEIITTPRSSIQSIQRRRVIRVRDRVIPVALFEEVFNTTEPDLQTATRDDASLTLVILAIQDENMGLVVDELIGQEDIVIKSVADNYRNVTGVAGASIMGDGTVSLILDVASTMAMFAERGTARFATERSGEKARPVATAG